MKWSIFGSPRRARRQRSSRLRVERLEDRRLLSATTASMDDAAYDEQEALRVVESYRHTMDVAEQSAMPAAYEDFKGGIPMVFKWQGNLVIYGTEHRDIVTVEEHPPAGSQPAQYFVKVTHVDGSYSASPTWHEARSTVPNNTIYFFGMNGDDNFSFKPGAGSLTRIVADGGLGADIMSGGHRSDFLDGGRYGTNTDRLSGQGGADILAGGPGKDFLWGEAGGIGLGIAGNDLLVGEAGNDTMLGGAGNDELFGCEDTDNLDGDSGDDYLNGGLGTDTLNGGGDKDYLDGGFDTVKDTLIGGPGGDEFMKRIKDLVRNFNPNEGDKKAPKSLPI